MKQVLTLLSLVLALVSCQEKKQTGSPEKTFSVTMASVSGHQETWQAGDYVYFSDDAATRPGFQYKAGGSDISADGKTLQAVYRNIEPGAKYIYATHGEQGRIRLGVTEEVTIPYDGKLGSATFPVGKTTVDASSVQLSPSLGVAAFSLKNPEIQSVRLITRKAIFPVKVKYDFKGKGLQVESAADMVEIPTVGKGPFYIPLIPECGRTALEIDFYDAGGLLIATTEVESVNLGVQAGSVLEVGDLDKDASEFADPIGEEMERASVALKNMGVGLNFGSGFEATWESLLQNPHRDDPSYYETVGKSASLFTPKTFQAAAEAGYKCARIPASWHHHMDDYKTSAIDKVWLDRIEDVVNYALDAGLYVIINMHHDAGSRVGRWCIADEEHYESTCAGITNIWTQIANRFKYYDEHLLFEAFNEILDDKNSWHYAKQESSYEIVNQYYQVFVNAVRATGGNNQSRNLILNTYGASVREPAISHFRMPEDVLPGHLMVEFHSYVPVAFCLESATDPRDNLIPEDAAAMEEVLTYAKQYLVSKGYPCILGEYGSFPKEGRSQEDRITYTKTMTRYCLDSKVVPIIWYSPMSSKTRSEGTWTDPEIRDAMISAYNEFLAAQ